MLIVTLVIFSLLTAVSRYFGSASQLNCLVSKLCQSDEQCLSKFLPFKKARSFDFPTLEKLPFGSTLIASDQTIKSLTKYAAECSVDFVVIDEQPEIAGLDKFLASHGSQIFLFKLSERVSLQNIQKLMGAFDMLSPGPQKHIIMIIEKHLLEKVGKNVDLEKQIMMYVKKSFNGKEDELSPFISRATSFIVDFI